MEEILVKYFQGEASPEETPRVEEFKQRHPDEYDLLEKLWQNRSRIMIRDFRTDRAWDVVMTQISTNPSRKTRSLYQVSIRWAAAIVFLAVASVLVWRYTQNSQPAPVVLSGAEMSGPVTLTDGTRVWLHQDAILSFPERFSGRLRQVELVGEGYFEVFRDTARLFIVTSGQAQIKVLGTSFNVRSTDSEVQVSVTSGLVEVASQQGGISDTFSKGQEALVSRAMISKRPLSPNFQAWRTGAFNFDNIPIDEAIQALNRYYRKGLDYETEGVDCRLTVTISDMDLAEVQELLESICELK